MNIEKKIENGGATPQGRLTAEEFNQLVDAVTNLEASVNELVGAAGIQRNIRISNNLDSRNVAASKGNPCILKFTFVSQERYSITDPYEDTGERGLLQLSVKNSTSDTYEVVKQLYISSGTVCSIDVAEWLTTGANNIMLKVTGEISEVTTPAFVYTVQLTSLSLAADNFKWWLACNGDITVPFNVGGNVSKVLHVTLESESYLASYQAALGTAVYTETAYNYTVPHPGKTGIYRLSAYVANADDTIRTRPIEYSIMCVANGDQTLMMAINNVAESATNWVENNLLQYSIHHGDAATAQATFTVKNVATGQIIYRSNQDNIPTDTMQVFTIPLEVETVDSGNFNIQINVTDVDGRPMAAATVIEVNNSLGYGAVPGAIFYLNPRTRNNAQDNRMAIINEMTGEEIHPQWTGTNGYNDIWTTDAAGNSVLRLMAGSSCNTLVTPLSPEAARTGRTIEMEYAISNVSDFDTPVIDCTQPHMGSFTGFRIYPDRVQMYSSALKDEDSQSFKFNTDERIHLTLCIMPNAYGNTDFNLCILYVNGVKNREFSYASNDYFLTESPLLIGSEGADIDIYGLRIYDKALSSEGILKKNYVSWRTDNEEKNRVLEHNDVYDAAGTDIDFEKVKKLCNVVVFEGEIPSYINPNKFRNNVYIYWRDNPERNVKIENAPQDGQGTSSMFYLGWNQRNKCDNNTIITYADGTQDVKKFTFMPGMPKVSKVTWKLNWASSCQCNKMGSVNSINDMATLLECLNEANSRVSIYQHPFAGFQLSWNDDGEPVYTFLGLYTGGPDKSDAGTMGLDTDTYPELLFVEGSDNASKCAMFKVPWNPKKGYIKYNADEEALQYNGENAWDYDSGAPETQEEVQALYEKIWMPRYNFVYQCSPNLTYWDGTLDELNSPENILLHRGDDTEFWLDGGNVYYYEAAEGKFIPSDIGDGTINLYSQLVDKGYGLTQAMLAGRTNSELNQLFIAARILKFSTEAPLYFAKNAAIFTRNWIEFKAGSDNRTKNTYFIMLGSVEDGYLCYFIHDDTDTIGPWTNQGQDKKGYWVEVGDKYANGQPVWNGEQNRFFNLMELAWAEDIRVEMHAYMNAMIELSGSNTGNFSDKLFQFFQKYYFDKAQEYFPQTLYNETARILYEKGKIALIAGTYQNDTDPMTQSMGDYYSGWKRWIKYRIQYMQSKYAFGDYSAAGTGHIIVRAAGNDITYNLTPAIWMYPCVATGTSIVRGERTPAGETCRVTISLGGSADQQNQIKGAHWLQSIGGWWDKNVTGTMTIVGRMLRELQIGHPTENITISITALQISDTPSLQLLDVRRIATLGGVLSLTACTHLRKVYASGTAVTQIALPPGGPLQHVEYSPQNQYVTLRNFPLLKASGVVMDECLTVVSDFLIENCPQLNPIDLLRRIMAAQAGQEAHTLKRVRAVGFDAAYEGSEGSATLDDLATLANGTYQGLDSSGLAGSETYPVLDGTITIAANCYEDSINTLRGAFTRLVLNITGEYYIRFACPAVAKICATQWGDGVGITRAQAAAVTDIGTVFKNNTEITSFDELRFFTGIKKIGDGAFYGCTLLRSIIYPPGLSTIGTQQTLSVLESVKIYDVENFYLGNNIQGVITINLIYIGSVQWFHDYVFRSVVVDKMYMANPIPPEHKSWGYGHNPNCVGDFYVPIGSANAYQEWMPRTDGYLEYDFELDPDGVKPPEL